MSPLVRQGGGLLVPFAATPATPALPLQVGSDLVPRTSLPSVKALIAEVRARHDALRRCARAGAPRGGGAGGGTL